MNLRPELARRLRIMSPVEKLTLGQVPFLVLFKGLFTGNATEIVLLLHSAVPSRGCTRTYRHPEPLCYERLAGAVPKDPGKHSKWPDFPPYHFVIIDSDDADETVPVVEPLVLREPIAPPSTGHVLLLFTATSTPPDDIGEVWP